MLKIYYLIFFICQVLLLNSVYFPITLILCFKITKSVAQCPTLKYKTNSNSAFPSYVYDKWSCLNNIVFCHYHKKMRWKQLSNGFWTRTNEYES